MGHSHTVGTCGLYGATWTDWQSGEASSCSTCAVFLRQATRGSLSVRVQIKHHWHSLLNIKASCCFQRICLRCTGSELDTLESLTVIGSMATGSTPTGRCHEFIHASLCEEYIHYIWRVHVHVLSCTVMSLGSRARQIRSYGMYKHHTIAYVWCVLWVGDHFPSEIFTPLPYITQIQRHNLLGMFHPCAVTSCGSNWRMHLNVQSSWWSSGCIH